MKVDKLKSALSNYPTGIVCVFSKTKGFYNAIIVNSFTSVSLNPPIVSWCLDKKSSKFKVFKNCKNQTIVILSNKQKKFANHIAFHRDKVSDLEFNKILKMSICDLYCAIFKKIKIGDHFTFFLKIKKISCIKKIKPLVFYKKKFLTI